MLSVTCELVSSGVKAPSPTKVLLRVPRSTYRYSSLAVQLGANAPSMPAPTVQPALVVVAVARAAALVVVAPGPKLGTTETVVPTSEVDFTSPTAKPPVA